MTLGMELYTYFTVFGNGVLNGNQYDSLTCITGH